MAQTTVSTIVICGQVDLVFWSVLDDSALVTTAQLCLCIAYSLSGSSEIDFERLLW